MDNKLINACYEMTLTQKRLFNLAIASVNSKKETTHSDTVSVSIEDFAELAKIDIHSALKAARDAVEPMSKTQVIDVEYKDKNIFKQRAQEKNASESAIKRVSYKNFFQSVEYIEDGAERLVRMQFADWLMPYISQIKRAFTEFQIQHTTPLSSFYAIRIYESVILEHFRYKGDETDIVASRTFDLVELRKTLGIIDDRYPRWSDFSKRCLRSPIESLNENTPFIWSFKSNGRGRWMKSVTISAARDEQQTLDFGDDDELMQLVRERED